MSIDSFLKKIIRLPNWINWLLLRVNIFGGSIYGVGYARKRRDIGRPIHEQSTFINLINGYLESTPYYKIKKLKISSLDQFRSMVPLIDKETVLESFNEFISNIYNEDDYIEGTTGGTTGKPMRILMPKNRFGFELAVVHSYWKTHGWSYHSRGVLRNHKLPSEEMYRINPLTKEIIFDAFRNDDEYIKFIHHFLKSKKIKFIQAYPSSAYQFCKRCKELGLSLNFIKAFFTSSEPVHSFQRAFISGELGVKLFNFYGHSEKLLIADNCRGTDYYHFEPSYGFAEILDDENQPVSQSGQWGYLVGTTYNNPGMPLLRYKTGDYAEYVGDRCPHCGKKSLVVKNIIGHYNQNIIYTNSGFTTTTAINLHSDLYLVIDGLQYVQEEVGKLVVNIKPNSGFTNEARAEFIKHFVHAMGSDSEVELKVVDQFQSLPNGKYPLLISRIDHGC